MDVKSVCLFSVDSLIWQPRASTWVLTFVCKAAFTLLPGEAVLAQEQALPLPEDEHWNDDPERSVRAPCDLLPVKPRAEVMLVGHAFAPGGAPVRSVTARVAVGPIDKSIEVVCDRVLTPEGAVQEGAWFQRMPLTYERAAGGPGTKNPAGLHTGARDAAGRRVLPNLQPVGARVVSPSDFIEPVGFGPIAASWPSRAEKLGRYGGVLAQDMWTARPLPEGLDLGYFNQAPQDQQLAALQENERLVLENLHVEHPRLVTSLPGLRPAAFVERERGAPQKLGLRADTLWIDTDRGIATVTWRGQLPLARPDEPGRVVVGMESPGREVTWAELDRAAEASRGSSAGMRAAARWEDMLATGGSSMASASGSGLDLTQDTAASTMVPSRSAPAAALPFASDLARPGSAPRDGRGASAPLGGLPFQGASPAPPHPPGGPPPPPPVRLSLSENAVDLPFSRTPPAPAMPPRVSPTPFGPPAPSLSAPRPVVSSPWASSAAGGGEVARNPIEMGAGAGSGAAAAASSVEDVGRGGAVGASNAAAAASVPWSLPKRDFRAVLSAPEVGGEEQAQEMLQLLWFDPDSVARIRRVSRWKKVLDELERASLDRDLDEAGGGDEPWEVEDRREVRAVLTRGDTTDATGVREALGKAIQKDGSFVAPLVLLAGDLELPLDELEALKAAVTTASPLVTPADEGLKASVEIAKDFLRTPGLMAAPSVSEGLTTRIREAFVREKKGLPADYLDAQMERVLLAGRHYQKREVLGGTYLRCLLWLSGEQGAHLGYLPADVAKKLPMFRRFRGRVIAEVHPAQDQYEVQGKALRVVALGRRGGAGVGAG
jgi:hypothetical protein